MCRQKHVCNVLSYVYCVIRVSGFYMCSFYIMLYKTNMAGTSSTRSMQPSSCSTLRTTRAKRPTLRRSPSRVRVRAARTRTPTATRTRCAASAACWWRSMNARGAGRAGCATARSWRVRRRCMGRTTRGFRPRRCRWKCCGTHLAGDTWTRTCGLRRAPRPLRHWF